MNVFKRYFTGYYKPGGMKELLLLALPMIISTACDGVMTFTDRLFLARVGSEQMNAALGGGITMQMLMFFFIGVIGYSNALTAQYFGAGEKSNSSKAAFQAILLALIAWPLLVILKPVGIWIFEYSDVSESQLFYQNQYLNILIWGSGLALLRFALGCYFSGIGKTQIVMVATVTAMIVNVILDYILIYGKLGFPSMGIQGAAIATVAGSFCALIVLLIPYFNKTNRVEFAVMKSFRFDKQIFKKLIQYGYPAGLELFLIFIAMFAMVAIFHSQGEVVATASTIMFNWDLVSFIPLLGIEIAVTSLVGRYMGAGRPQMAHRTAISGIKIGLFYSFAILVLFVFFPEFLVRIFHPGKPDPFFENAVPIAVQMIRIASLYVLAEAVMVAYVGALRGAGDTLFTMMASVSAHLFFVPILYFSLNVLGFSVPISWFMIVVGFLVFVVALAIRFNKGKWKTINVIH